MNTFLLDYLVKHNSVFTHTSFSRNIKGSFYIPSDAFDRFLDIYKACLAIGEELSITEKHRDICPILIDLDFRQASSTRLYSQKHIIDFLQLLKTELESCLDVSPEQMEFYVLEKPEPRQNKGNGYKDGIHIVCPYIVTKPDVQYVIRNNILRKDNPFADCGYNNSYADMYDEAVIERNNWFMYGSKKPDEKHPWALTKVYNAELQNVNYQYTNDQLVELLSIRNKFDEIKPVIPIELPKKPEKVVAATTTQGDRNKVNHFDIEYASQLVSLLDVERSHDYHNWMRVGWALHNVCECEELLNAWIGFSKQSDKFRGGECERLWQGMRGGLGLGTLCMWAKQDNPSGFKELLNTRIYDQIKACNGTHNAIAAIAYKILRGRFVCATANGRLWYEFNGALWQEDKEAIHLRHELSTTVKEQFVYSIHVLHRDLSIDELQSALSSTNTRRQTAEGVKTLNHIAMKLEDSGFKDNVVKEMREYFYDRQFMQNLDSKKHLLGFKNGVWDFHMDHFRTASPEDCVSINVGYDYIEEGDYEKRRMVDDYWSKLHPHEEQRMYVIRMFAKQLYGDSGNELFHIHAGSKNSAGNGKTKFFDTMEMVLGDYVRKFPVQVLTATKREEAGKPAPEYNYWRGRRILYCSEPNTDDTLNSGIMKDLTGGEKIIYRLLYSNDVLGFRPQFKMHIMCNDPPKVDGSDEGVKRRIRKIDYMARFVEADQVDESKFHYKIDSTFFDKLRGDDGLKMEVLRYFLDHYHKNYEYQMPEFVANNSRIYLEENDGVRRFIADYIVKDKDGFFTLADAKEIYKMKDYNGNRVTQLKVDLQKHLGVDCVSCKKVKGKVLRNVFVGYSISYGDDTMDFLD